MHALPEEDSRFRRLELKVGMLLVVALAGVIAVLALVARERGIFARQFTLTLVAESGVGLHEGMPVKLLGFRVGKVQEMELTDSGKVQVTVAMSRKYQRWAREGSVARLAREGVIGEAFVEIAPGRPEARLLEDGETIRYERRTMLADELVKEGRPLLADVHDFLGYLNHADGDLKVTLRHTREMTATLAGVNKRLEASLAEAEKALGEIRLAIGDARTLVKGVDAKLGTTLEAATATLKSVEVAVTDLRPILAHGKAIAENSERASAHLPGLVERATGILEDVRTLSGSLATEAPRISGMLAEAEAALAEARELVSGAKAGSLGKLLLPPPKPVGLIPLDGYAKEPSR